MSANFVIRCVAAFMVLVGLAGAEPYESAAAQQRQSDPVERLSEMLPKRVWDFEKLDPASVSKATEAVEQWSVRISRYDEGRQGSLRRATGFVQMVRQLVTIKKRVDRLLDETFGQRKQFASMRAGKNRRTSIRHYLHTTSGLIDLSGRLRYLLYDAINDAANEVAAKPKIREQLIDFLIALRCSIGADAMVVDLFDPPQNGQNYVPAASAFQNTLPPPVSDATKAKLLILIAVTYQVELLPEVVRFIEHEKTPPGLVILASEVIQRIGLPQNARPGQDPNLPKPEITARRLHKILSQIAPSRISISLQRRRQAVLDWLGLRMKRGLVENRYRLGRFFVQPGDWLLMRNPSPYNLFTDLSPGLFTHVGVVAFEQGRDGLRRMVLVDLPERGRRIPATNIETFVKRTRHYVLLRHPDPAVARKMGEVAKSVIGNESQFDLNFRTEHVVELKHKPLTGRKITTYCAGLLLLCAQETSAPQKDFFPIPEFPARGNTVRNLAKLGLTFGDNFISPTGALFSPRLSIVGRRQPMYSPNTEIEEAIFDHFARSLAHRTLVPSGDLYQNLRLKVARLAKNNPLLAQALAKAANINEKMDLVSAAKAAAVVETLDQIAFGASGDFFNARAAIQAGPIDPLITDQYSPEQIRAITRLRQAHSRLYNLWQAERISPRNLRIELVKTYIQRGKHQIDERFFRTKQ